MSAIRLQVIPPRAVPAESPIASLQNRRSAIECAVRTYADLRVAAERIREEAIDTALTAYDCGASAASAIEAGQVRVRGVKR